MRFRFRKYNSENDKYDYITSIDIADFDKMFKTLTFMKEHKCIDYVELNTEDIVDVVGSFYEVEDVALSISEAVGDDALIPIFVVDLV